MSNYLYPARNPETGEVEIAMFLDDYFGKHRYGVRFADGNVAREEDLLACNALCKCGHTYDSHAASRCLDCGARMCKKFWHEEWSEEDVPKKRSMKIMLLGHGRGGKDTVADILKDELGLNACSSSWFCAEKFIFEALRHTLGYETVKECFEDRFNHRAAWFGLIKSYNAKDPGRLAREIFAENDIYVGIRSNVEFECAKAEGLFDLAIWVDASTRNPLEDGSSFDIDLSKADFVIDNNGTEADLVNRMKNLIRLFRHSKE
jgi:hypothetical protein